MTPELRLVPQDADYLDITRTSVEVGGSSIFPPCSEIGLQCDYAGISPNLVRSGRRLLRPTGRASRHSRRRLLRVLAADGAFAPRHLDLVGRESEHVAHDLGGVLAEQG